MHDAVRKLGTMAFITLVVGACGEITDPNTAPTADAGPDQDAFVGEVVQLDGSGSDPDGDPLTYQWSFSVRPDTSSATITNANSASASFVPDVPGDYTLTLEVSDGEDTATDDASVTVTYDTRLGGSIEADTTLRNVGQPYHVVGNLSVSAAVTIEAGAELRFAQGTRLRVATGGSLIAVGAQDDSIRFVGEQAQAGFWDGIEVLSNDPDNELTYVVVAHGGADGWADVYVQSGGAVKVTNSSLRSSATYGIEAESGTSLAGFSSNAFADNVMAALNIPAALIGQLDAASEFGAGSQIAVSGGSVATAQHWPATAAPYLFTLNTTLEDSVKIAPGAVLRFGQGLRFIVASGAVLRAVGTDTDSIRFVGDQAQAGYWDGIEIESNSPNNELTYVELGHGGSDIYANVYVQSGGAVTVTNSRIHTSATYGVTVEEGASLEGFSANTFHDHTTASLTIRTHVIGELDNASDYGSGADRIDVWGGSVTTSQTWPKTNVPFRFTGYPTVEGDVTVEPGARFEFEQGLRLIVSGEGSLAAVGTESDTIRFTGTQDAAGHWDGIDVASANVANELTYTEVANGGADGWADIYVHSTGVMKVTNSLIRTSSTYGIEVEDGGSLAGFARNTFSGHTLTAMNVPTSVMGQLDAASTYVGGHGDDYITVFGGTVTTSQTWPKTDAPFFFSGSATIESDITVEAGARFLFGQSHRLRVATGGSLNAVGTASDTVAFLGEQALAGYWDGIEIVAANASNVLDYTEIGYGGADGWANVYVQSTGTVTVTNSYIHDSETWGIEVESGGSLTDSGNTYSGNSSGDVIRH